MLVVLGECWSPNPEQVNELADFGEEGWCGEDCYIHSSGGGRYVDGQMTIRTSKAVKQMASVVMAFDQAGRGWSGARAAPRPRGRGAGQRFPRGLECRRSCLVSTQLCVASCQHLVGLRAKVKILWAALFFSEQGVEVVSQSSRHQLVASLLHNSPTQISGDSFPEGDGVF